MDLTDIEYFKMMEPMRYYDNENPASDNLKAKRDALISNRNNSYVATVKNDGEWACFINGENDDILIRSRTISKVTGVYGDKTEHLPHLVEEMKNWPENTVILAEVCWGELGTVSTDVGTIMRCLPKKAVERQKDKKLIAKMFDILMYNGENMMDKPYIERIEFLKNIFPQTKYFSTTEVIYDNFEEYADEYIRKGGEGIVIQAKNNPYMPGTRKAWATLKLKQKMPEMELLVTGTLNPAKYYDGIEPNLWNYWEGYYEDEPEKKIRIDHSPGNIDMESGLKWYPVTKPYWNNWKNGITIQFEDTTCDVTSGLTDADREWLATSEAQEMIKNKELYAVVRAMQKNTLGKLRHPYLIRLRNDI